MYTSNVLFFKKITATEFSSDSYKKISRSGFIPDGGPTI